MSMNETKENIVESPKNEAVPDAVVEISPASAGFCAYIGPSIAGCIQKGTIYHGSKGEVLKNNDAVKMAVDRYPLIAELLVDGNDLASAQVRVKNPDNYLYKVTKKLLDK